MKTIKTLLVLLFIGAIQCMAQEYSNHDISILEADGVITNLPVDVSLENSSKKMRYSKVSTKMYGGEQILGLTFYGYNPGNVLNRHFKISATTDYFGKNAVCVYDHDVVIPSGGTETDYIPLLSFAFDTPFALTGSVVGYLYLTVESSGETSETPLYFAYNKYAKLPTLNVKLQAEVKELTGFVRSQDKMAVKGAKVSLSNANLGVTLEGISGEDGSYSIRVERSSWLYPAEVSANGHSTYLSGSYSAETSSSVVLEGERPTRDFTLYNKLVFKKGQRATIILPVEPDPAWGRFYRLDRRGINSDEEACKLYFERELSPKANVPYVIFPNNDFELNIGDYDLNLEPGSFTIPIPEELQSKYPDHECYAGVFGSYKNQITSGLLYTTERYLYIDDTPDCQAEFDVSPYGHSRIGACRAYFKMTFPVLPLQLIFVGENPESYIPDGVTLISVQEQTSDSHNIFDLQGRKVQGQPTRGIYIKDGKKVVMK